MLGKLIKHEWKGTCKVGGLILILLAGITFFGWLAFQSPMWNEMAGDSIEYNMAFSILDLMSIFTLFAYMFLLLGAVVGIMIYLAVHFYQTMYTDEGYLLHTLPVTKGRLLFSKVFIGGLWMLIILIGVYTSMVALISFMMGRLLAPEGYTVWGIWELFFGELGEAILMMEKELNFKGTVYLVYTILTMLSSPFITMIVVFGAISMGQLFTKHRVLMAIVCYGGVLLANGLVKSIVEAIIATLYDFSSFEKVMSFFDRNLISGTILSVLFAAVMYFVSYYVNTRKLNME